MVVASQLVGKVEITGADQAKTILLNMADNSKKAQESLDKLQNAAKIVGNSLGSQLSNQIKNAQNSFQDLGSRAKDSGINIDKFTSLQTKAAEAAAKLTTAETRTADAQAKANAMITNGKSSAEQLAVAQSRAAEAAAKVGTAENAAGIAMQKVQTEASRLAEAMQQDTTETSVFSRALDAVKGALGSLGERFQIAGNEASAFKEKSEASSGGLLSGFKGAAGGIVDFFGKAGLALNGAQMAWQTAIGVGKFLLGANADLEQVRVSFQAFIPDAKELTTTLAGLKKFAAVTPFEAPEVNKAALSLLNMKVEAKDLTTWIGNIGAAVSKVGGDGLVLDEVTQIIQQMGVKGKVTTEEMLQLSERNIPAFQILADAMHVPVSSLQDMISKGQLGKDKIDLLVTSMGKFGGDAMIQQGKTFNGLLSTLQDNATQALAAFTGPLFDAAKSGLTVLGNLVSSSAFQDFATGAGKKVAEVFGAIGNVLQSTVVPWFHTFQEVIQLPAMRGLGERLGQVWDALKGVGGAFSDLFGAMSPVRDLFQANTKSVGDGETTLDNFAIAIFKVQDAIQNYIVPAIDGFGAIIRKVTPFLQGEFNHALQDVGAVARQVGDWFKSDVAPALKDAAPGFASLGDTLMNTVVPAFFKARDIGINFVEHVFKAFGPVIEKLLPPLIRFEGFMANNVSNALKFLTPYILDISKALGDFVDDVVDRVGPIVSQWFDSLSTTFQLFWKGWMTAWPTISAVLKGVWDEMVGWVKIAWSLISGVVKIGLDVMSGNWKQAWTDMGDMLGGVWDGIKTVVKGGLETMLGLFRPLLEGMTSIPGPAGDMARGVLQSFSGMSIGSQLHTAQMKDKSIENAQKMNEATQLKFQMMREGVEKELSQTTDAAKRHTLEMKLKTIENAQAMSQEAGRNIVDMRTKSQEQLDLLKQGVDTSMMSAADKAKYHSLNMKDMYLQGVISMDNDSIKKVDEMRLGILDELSRTTDGAKKQSLETQLTQVTNAENTAKKVKDSHVKMRTDTESEMDKLKKSISDKSAGIMGDITGFFGGIGKWFGDRWHDVQGAFGNTGQWFHDRWNEAWTATTGVFGNIGGWFTDRWHDIQGVFGAIGKWFSDRWSDVMNSTAPFRDYMGAVFETIGRIVHALFGKLGAWFADRWNEVYAPTAAFVGMVGAKMGEAWAAVVGAFQWLGKWFGDRWQDTKNILAPVGQVFHDLFTAGWNAVVGAFQFLGKWFGDRWQDAKNILAGVGGYIHDRFQEGWNHVVTIFSPLGKTFQGYWNDVMGGVNTLKTNMSNVWNTIKTNTSNIFKGMINGIIDQLNNGIQSFAGFINFFARGLNDLADKLTGTPGNIPIVAFKPIPHYAAGTDSHPGGPAIVGERGRELVMLPKGAQVAPNNITEMLLAMTGGKIPGYAEGIGDIGSKIMQWVAGGAKSVLDGLISTMHISAPHILGMSNIAGGMFDTIKKYALSWIGSILPAFNASTAGGHAVNVPGNVASWIAQAMALTHVPSNWATDLGVIAMHESGGNPNAINRTDSNALAGHPSQGLFQTIPSTFAAHMLPGHTNILNPIDNAASAIGYIKGRYGDVFHVPGIVAMSHGQNYVGYANGGIINEPINGIGLLTGTNYKFGEKGKELVTPYVPSGVNLAQSSQPPANITIIVQPNDFNVDGRKMSRALEPYRIEDARRISGAKI